MENRLRQNAMTMGLKEVVAAITYYADKIPGGRLISVWSDDIVGTVAALKGEIENAKTISLNGRPDADFVSPAIGTVPSIFERTRVLIVYGEVSNSPDYQLQFIRRMFEDNKSAVVVIVQAREPGRQIDGSGSGATFLGRAFWNNMIHLEYVPGAVAQRKPQALQPEDAGREITIRAKIGYPGSRVTDVVIGGHVVQVPNDALRAATVEAL